jgi:hypothetical protein
VIAALMMAFPLYMTLGQSQAVNKEYKLVTSNTVPNQKMQWFWL